MHGRRDAESLTRPYTHDPPKLYCVFKRARDCFLIASLTELSLTPYDKAGSCHTALLSDNAVELFLHNLCRPKVDAAVLFLRKLGESESCNQGESLPGIGDQLSRRTEKEALIDKQDQSKKHHRQGKSRDISSDSSISML